MTEYWRSNHINDITQDGKALCIVMNRLYETGLVFQCLMAFPPEYSERTNYPLFLKTGIIEEMSTRTSRKIFTMCCKLILHHIFAQYRTLENNCSKPKYLRQLLNLNWLYIKEAKLHLKKIGVCRVEERGCGPKRSWRRTIHKDHIGWEPTVEIYNVIFLQ